MLKNVGNMIISSVSMAFMVILSWSIAYAYEWGRSYYYGYPWWYVEINTGNIARSIGYVLFATLTLLLFSVFSLFLVRKIKPFLNKFYLNLFRAFVLSAILWLPIVMSSFILIGKLHSSFIISYAILVIVFTVIFKEYIEDALENYFENANYRTITRYLNRMQNYIMIFLYSYFVLIAFLLGYAKPHFTYHFDMLEVNHKMYYVLAKYDDAIILSKDVKQDRKNFYIYRTSTSKLAHLKVNLPLGIQQHCYLDH